MLRSLDHFINEATILDRVSHITEVDFVDICCMTIRNVSGCRITRREN